MPSIKKAKSRDWGESVLFVMKLTATVTSVCFLILLASMEYAK